MTVQTKNKAPTPDMPPESFMQNSSPLWSFFANVWLLFLIFPLLGVLTDDSLGETRQIVGVALIAAFAAVHVAGYIHCSTSRASRVSIVGWFIALIAITAAGLVIAGPNMIGVAPFLTPFASVNFSIRTAFTTLATTLAAVFLTLLLYDLYDDGLIIIPLIVFAVGCGSIFARQAGESEADAAAAQSQLQLTEERSRVARDVHDVLGHSLTAVILKTQVAERQLAAIESPSTEVTAAQTQLNEIHLLSRQALSEIRDTVDGLRATTLEGELDAARLVLADANVALSTEGSPSEVPDEYHSVIGWTLREAVTNIVRHSKAATCRVDLTSGPELIRIYDDGVGRDGAIEGNGLIGLRQRLARHDLELRIEDPLAGTAISVVRS